MGCGQSSETRVGNIAQNDEVLKIERKLSIVPKDGNVAAAVASTMDEVEAEAADYSIIRLLLLGAAESGKTTLLEQIRLLYKQNYSEPELFHRRAFIYNNILNAVRSLICRLQQTDGEFEKHENKEHAEFIMTGEDTQYSRFTDAQEAAISSIWNDPAIQNVYRLRGAFNLNDSTKYFLENISKLNNDSYVPTPKDLIMSYVPTVGVQNVIFTANNRAFQLFDCGGQRIDRRKWATMYDGINAIFFCLAISEYDQTMNEDMTTNRISDGLGLLTKISEEEKFKDTPLFLFLNEVDVFREKIQNISLSLYQPEYRGSTVEEALDFMERIAREAAGNRPDALLHVYRITCVDTDSMSKILSNVFKTILKHN